MEATVDPVVEAEAEDEVEEPETPDPWADLAVTVVDPAEADLVEDSAVDTEVATAEELVASLHHPLRLAPAGGRLATTIPLRLARFRSTPVIPLASLFSV